MKLKQLAQQYHKDPLFLGVPELKSGKQLKIDDYGQPIEKCIQLAFKNNFYWGADQSKGRTIHKSVHEYSFEIFEIFNMDFHAIAQSIMTDVIQKVFPQFSQTSTLKDWCDRWRIAVQVDVAVANTSLVERNIVVNVKWLTPRRRELLPMYNPEIRILIEERLKYCNAVLEKLDTAMDPKKGSPRSLKYILGELDRGIFMTLGQLYELWRQGDGTRGFYSKYAKEVNIRVRPFPDYLWVWAGIQYKEHKYNMRWAKEYRTEDQENPSKFFIDLHPDHKRRVEFVEMIQNARLHYEQWEKEEEEKLFNQFSVLNQPKPWHDLA